MLLGPEQCTALLHHFLTYSLYLSHRRSKANSIKFLLYIISSFPQHLCASHNPATTTKNHLGVQLACALARTSFHIQQRGFAKGTRAAGAELLPWTSLHDGLILLHPPLTDLCQTPRQKNSADAPGGSGCAGAAGTVTALAPW